MKQAVIFCIGILLLIGVGLLMSPKAEQNTDYDPRLETVEAGKGEDHFQMTIVYQGKRYESDWAYEIDLPTVVELVGQISEVTDDPQQELACSKGCVGDNVYTFEFEGKLCIARELPIPPNTAPVDAKSMFRGQVIGMTDDDVTRYRDAEKNQ